MATIKNLGTLSVPEPLNAFLDLLLIKKPTVEFHVGKKNREDECISVKVIEDGFMIGGVGFRKTGRRFDSKLGYAPSTIDIYSKKIEKYRGQSDVVSSSNPSTALKNALKYFKKTSDAEYAANLVESGTNLINECGYHRKYELSSVIRFGTRDMQMFFAEWAMQVKSNADTSKAFPENIVKVDFPKLEACLEERKAHESVARSMDNKDGYLIEILHNESILVCKVHNHDIKTYRSFEDMPVELQGKFAVLKIANRYDAIDDIGVKLADSFYYVIASEL